MKRLTARRRNATLFAFGGGIFAVAGFVAANRQPAVAIQRDAVAEYSIDRAESNELFEADRMVFKRGLHSRPEVCLTFDDGPHGTATASILDTLKAKGAPATFFVVGKMVERHPELVRRMIAEGHEVGNHTYEHLRLDQLPEAQIEQELAACESAVERATGHRMALMRPPGMRVCDPLIQANRRFGYIMVGWTIGAKDFVGHVPARTLPKELRGLPPTTPAMIVQRVEKQLKNGGVVLLHDNPVVAEALPGIVDAIRARGFTIVSPSRMMAELPQNVTLMANPAIHAHPSRRVN